MKDWQVHKWVTKKTEPYIYDKLKMACEMGY